MRNKLYRILSISFILFLLSGYFKYEIFAQTDEDVENIVEETNSSKDNPQESYHNLKSEIIYKQTLSKSKQSLGTFGNIVDKMFSIPAGFKLANIRPAKYTKDDFTYEVYYLLGERLNLKLERDKEGTLNKVTFTNNILSPYESRRIVLDFNHPDYPDNSVVKIYISLLGGQIRYSNLLLFKKGEIEPYWMEDEAIKLWGENTVRQTQKLLNQIFKESITRHGLDPESNNLGFFEKFRNFIKDLPKRLDDEDILKLTDLNLSKGMKKSFWVDHYILNEFASVSIIKKQNGKIKSVVTLNGLSLDKIVAYHLDYVIDGLDVFRIIYDCKNYKVISKDSFHIPLTEKKPVKK